MEKYNKVIIIGAGRSGTNMLRDILVKIPGFNTWDCDEINPIWKHGNIDNETDELTIKDATKNVKTFIRKKFNKIQRSTNASVVIEKTCANSLRVPFVYSIFPEAKYIFIFRDGRDVVPSAMKRWNSQLDLIYTLKKVRYVPLTDLPYYIFKYGMNRVSRIFKSTERLSFWGPIYDGISEDVTSKSLKYICARQWARCVEKSVKDMVMIPEENIYTVSYEKFVASPESSLKDMTNFLSIGLDDQQISNFVSNVRASSIGNYKDEFSKEQLDEIMPVMKKALSLTGYE